MSIGVGEAVLFPFPILLVYLFFLFLGQAKVVQLLSEHDEAVIGAQEEVGVVSAVDGVAQVDVVLIGVAEQDQNFQKAVLVLFLFPFPFPFPFPAQARVVQKLSDDEWQLLYHVDLSEQGLADEVSNEGQEVALCLL